MRRVKRGLAVFLCLAALAAGLSGCSARCTSIDCVIGVSLANLREQWRLVLKDELEAEAKKYEGVRLVITDAAGDSEKQAEDVERLMSYGIDLLIISPSDVEALTPVIGGVYEEIPVIVMDRAVEGYNYSLFIGPDNDLIGRQAGKTVLELLGERGTPNASVLELKNDSFASESRSAEFVKTVSEAQVTTRSIDLAEATRDCAEDTLLADPEVLKDIDVIFAHNDYMAYGAHLALERLNIHGIQIVGLDGFSGENGGLQLVEQGMIDATVTCPTGGTEAIRYAVDIINQVSGIPKQIILRSHQIRQDNAADYQREAPVQERPSVIRVGYAQIEEESHWREACTESIRQAAKDFDIDLTMEFTQPLVEEQTELVRKFIAQKMDVIIVSPVVAEGWLTVLEEARAAGIPVLLVDRMVDAGEELYTSFIGADFEEEGRRCARWLMNETAGMEEVRVMELRGTEGSSPAQDRKAGFGSTLNGSENCKLVYSTCGEFAREGGRVAVREYLSRQPWDIDAIYAHNDDMALGAVEVLLEEGMRPGTDVKIMSIDGTADALRALQSGNMNCVVECNPLLGPQLMKAVTDLMQGNELPLRIITDESVFTADTPKVLFQDRKY